MSIKYMKDLGYWGIFNREGNYVGSIRKEGNEWRYCFTNGKWGSASNFHDCRWYAYNAY